MRTKAQDTAVLANKIKDRIKSKDVKEYGDWVVNQSLNMTMNQVKEMLKENDDLLEKTGHTEEEIDRLADVCAILMAFRMNCLGFLGGPELIALHRIF